MNISGSTRSWFSMDDHRPGVAIAPGVVIVPGWAGPSGDVAPIGFRLPRRHRLRGRRDFDRVYGARVSRRQGPLILYAVPAEDAYWRLGLSVSRRVGTAVRRNRIKRLLREVFRLHRHAWPAAYDLVIVVLPHEPRHLDDYVRWLTKGVQRLHRAWIEETPRDGNEQ